MAKQVRIRQIQNKDIQMMSAISKCGHIDIDHARSFIGGKNPDRRIGAWLTRGVIQATPYRNRNGEERIAYSLSEKGRDFTTKHMNIVNHQPTNSDKCKHDIGTAKVYMSLSLCERETYLSESVATKLLKEKLEDLKVANDPRYEEIYKMYRNHDISPTDAIYIRDGESTYTCLETITRNYTEQMILAKQNFAELMGYEMNMVRV